MLYLSDIVSLSDLEDEFHENGSISDVRLDEEEILSNISSYLIEEHIRKHAYLYSDSLSIILNAKNLVQQEAIDLFAELYKKDYHALFDKLQELK